MRNHELLLGMNEAFDGVLGISETKRLDGNRLEWRGEGGRGEEYDYLWGNIGLNEWIYLSLFQLRYLGDLVGSASVHVCATANPTGT